MAKLRGIGHDVYGIDLRHSPDEHEFRADVAEYRQLRQAFMDTAPEIVYHLAAEFGRFNGELYYEDLWRTAMVGTRNVLELCREFGARLSSPPRARSTARPTPTGSTRA